MYDKFISYDDIFDWQDDVTERLEKNPIHPDQNISEDLVALFEIADICNQIDNFVEKKENELDSLYDKLHYSYNEFGERNDHEYRQKCSKDILKNSKWKEEIDLVKEKDKIDTLMYIKQKGLIVDKLKFLNENDVPIVCLSAVIWDVDTWYNDDEDPCVFVLPEYILNATWNIQLPEEDDVSLEINIDQIKEIIVDETKYTFLL